MKNFVPKIDKGKAQEVTAYNFQIIWGESAS